MKIAGAPVGSANPFFLIAGPCVIESEAFALDTAGEIKRICSNLSIPFVYKSSYDKANRTSIDSYRGLGMLEGLEILQKVKTIVDVPVLTDVHSPDEAATAANYVDIIQTPAFLCRQTDLITAAASSGFGCVSTNNPSIPTPTAARAKVGTNSLCPPDAPSFPPGNCTE